MTNALDDIPYMDPEETKQLAGIATKKANRAVNSYEKIREELHKKLNDSPGGIVPPEYAEIIVDDAYYQEIKDIHEIIQSYADMDFDRESVDRDVVRLSAIVVRISTLVGYSKGIANASTDQRKLMNARMHIYIREIAEDLNLKITESAAESMSKDESQEYAETAAYAVTAYEMLQSLYYAAMAFVRVLESAAQRKSHEYGMTKEGRV